MGISIALAENGEHWAMFLQFLQENLGISPCFLISDREKGLMRATAEFFPLVPQYVCSRHVMENFKKKFKCPELKKMGWALLTSFNEQSFLSAKDKILQHPKGQLAFDWFENVGLEKVCVAKSSTPRFGVTTTNNVESVNAALLKVRSEGVLSLLEGVEKMTLIKQSDLWNEAKSWSGPFTKFAAKKLDLALSESLKLQGEQLSKNAFLIKCSPKLSFMVNIEEKNFNCSCSSTLAGLPCAHVIAALNIRNLSALTYVSDVWKKEIYLQAYQPKKHQSLVLFNELEINMLQPPEKKRGRGRPKRKRIESQHSKKIKSAKK